MKNNHLALDKLNPNFISGFIDGEGCFSLYISKNDKLKIGWRVKLSFIIELHGKDLPLLNQIHNFFGVGVICLSKRGNASFQVSSINDLINVIIPHFDKYPLITQKQADFLLFKSALILINKGEHLTNEGLNKIISIKASINLGFSEMLITAFPNILSIPRPLVKLPENLNPNWLAGFASAEGCFYVSISKSKTKVGYAVYLWFILTQHLRDKALFEVIQKYLDCGNITIDNKNSAVRYKVSKFTDNLNVIIPEGELFFEKSPIYGAKAKDFSDFCKIAYLIKDKAHLTCEGLEKIKNLNNI